jgi:hypothetical protein
LTAFDDAWHHIAFTFDSGTLKLFVDGVEDVNPTKTNDHAISSLHDSTADLSFGN